MSTYVFNLTADQMVRQALQHCGVVGLGMPVLPEMLQDGRDKLSTILKALQARGTTLSQLVRATLVLSPGQSSYVLPAAFIDVEDEQTTLLLPNGSTTETYVDRMAYADWRIISDKSISGLPTRVYIEKSATVCTAFFWSVPDQAYTWEYRGVQLLPDMSTGGQLSELAQKWVSALTWRLAYWLSFPLNVPQMRRQELKTNADDEEKIVLGQEVEHVDLNLMLPPNPYGSY